MIAAQECLARFSSEEAAIFPPLRNTAAAQPLKATFVDPTSDEEWDRAVAAHPAASVFHTSAWAKVLCDTYRHQPLYLRLTSGDSESALLPLMEVTSRITGVRGVSLPFSDACPPLLSGGIATDSDVLDAVNRVARQRRWKYTELRGGPFAAPAFAKYYQHTIDLTPSRDALFASCTSAFRRGIRKAERANVRVEVRTDADAIREYYRLHTRTRRRHGIPPQPFSFFRNIHTHLVANGLAFIVVASQRASAIAAAIFFRWNQSAIFKFGASDERHQGARPSNLVMWAGLKECARLGATTLDLGRTDVPQEGLRRFKLALGAREETLSYVRYDAAVGRWLTNRSATTNATQRAIFRSLPLTLTKLAGTMLYPHLH